MASVLSWPKARGVWRAATDRRTKRRQHLRAVQEGPGDPLAPADHVAPARGKSKDLARSPGPRPGPGESCGLAQPPPLPAPAGLHAAQGANTPSSPCFTSSPHPTSALERNAEVPGIDGGLRGEIEGHPWGTGSLSSGWVSTEALPHHSPAAQGAPVQSSSPAPSARPHTMTRGCVAGVGVRGCGADRGRGNQGSEGNTGPERRGRGLDLGPSPGRPHGPEPSPSLPWQCGRASGTAPRRRHPRRGRASGLERRPGSVLACHGKEPASEWLTPTPPAGELRRL